MILLRGNECNHTNERHDLHTSLGQNILLILEWFIFFLLLQKKRTAFFKTEFVNFKKMLLFFSVIQQKQMVYREASASK